MQAWQERLWIYFTPLLLITIALFQIYTARMHGLTPWKGGGFGMFSTVDSGGARFLRIYVTNESGEVIPVSLPNTQAYVRLQSRLRRLPQQKQMARLASQLAAETWVPADYRAFYPSSSPTPIAERTRYRVAFDGEPVSADKQVVLQQIEIELWRYRFDGSSGIIAAGLWQDYTHTFNYNVEGKNDATSY